MLMVGVWLGGRVHWFALIDQKFMSEYKGRSRFVLGNI